MSNVICSLSLLHEMVGCHVSHIWVYCFYFYFFKSKLRNNLIFSANLWKYCWYIFFYALISLSKQLSLMITSSESSIIARGLTRMNAEEWSLFPVRNPTGTTCWKQIMGRFINLCTHLLMWKFKRNQFMARSMNG